ncbi:MAG: hypothetical protein U1F43_02305 [Myxococcota bacterium]
MVLKSAKKLIDNVSGKKDKSKGAPTTPPPRPTTPAPTTNKQAPPRPTTPAPTDKQAPPRPTTPAPGTPTVAQAPKAFVKGAKPGTPQPEGSQLGAQRAWKKTTPKANDKAPTSPKKIGENRKITKALEKQESKTPLPTEVKEKVEEAKEVEKVAPVVEKAKHETPPANKYSASAYTTTVADDEAKSPYTTTVDDGESPLRQSQGKVGAYSSEQKDAEDDMSSQDDVSSDALEVQGLDPNRYAAVQHSDVATFSSSDDGFVSEEETSSSGEVGAPMQIPKAQLLMRIKAAKVAKLRADRAKEKEAEKAKQEDEAKQKSNETPKEEVKEEVKEDAPPTNYGSATNYASASSYTMTGSDSMAHYGNRYSSISSDDEPDLSSTGFRTDDMSAHTAEIDMASDLEDAAAAIPNVQERHTASKNPEVKAMQQKLRDGRRNLKDAPEVVNDSVTGQHIATNQIERERMSSNERKSEGWALLGMRTEHREQDLGKKGGRWDVKYALSEFAEIEAGVEQLLGDKLRTGREEMLCEVYGGRLVDVAGRGVDTSSAGVSGQAQHDRTDKLREKIEKAKQAGFGDKVAKLEKKLDTAVKDPRKDKSISGRFIYVMNASGQFFACKPELYKVHHSAMLAGGAVACAGEMLVSGGTIQAINNSSGHYRPGPAFLWQAVKQLEMSGASMGFQVECAAVTRKFKTGTDFLSAMDPTTDAKLFDGVYAVKKLNAR